MENYYVLKQSNILYCKTPRFQPEIEHYDRTGTKITYFSDEARARLRKELETFDFTGRKIIQFVCSYSDRSRPDSATDKKIFKLFLLGIIRQIGDVFIFWKREFQENSSPHYHVVIDYTNKNLDQLLLAYIWIKSFQTYMMPGKIQSKLSKNKKILNDMWSVHIHPKQVTLCYNLDSGAFAHYLSTHYGKGKQNQCPEDFDGRFYGYRNRELMPLYPIVKYIGNYQNIWNMHMHLNRQKISILTKKRC